MNLEKLYTAEAVFLERYPGGFEHADMVEIGKKHRVEKLAEQAGALLAETNFSNQAQVLDDIVKIVSRSSMVSRFEKPKFRDFVNGSSRNDRAALLSGFRNMLHGDQQRGFEEVLDILSEGKLARWSLMTTCLLYYRPQAEVFVKPTTTKGVIRQFEVENLVYKPRPSWEFYRAYRALIEDMKSKVHPSLSPNNAAFTGFLMMTSAVAPQPLTNSRVLNARSRNLSVSRANTGKIT